MQTENFSERLAVVGAIPPAAARNTGSYSTAWIDAARFERLLGVLNVGTLAGTGTVFLRFDSASTSAGGGSASISSACVTSTFASTDNDEIGLLELRLDQNPSVGRFIRGVASVAVSNGWVGNALVLGEPGIYGPASDYDAAAVTSVTVF